MRLKSFLYLATALVAIGPCTAFAQACEDQDLDPAQRITLCDQAFTDSDGNEAAAIALAMKGQAQRQAGDLAAAAETLAQSLGYGPARGATWVELGNVRYDQNDIPGALASYSAALAVEDNPDAYANRAETWWEYRMGDNCLADADQALRIDPEFAYANEIKGRCLVDLGRSDEAIAAFDAALALYPAYQNALRNKIAALAALGRHEEAVAVADLALQPGFVTDSNPVIEEDIRSRRLLSLARYAAADVVTREAQALLQLYPDNPAAVNIQARALLASANFAEADKLTAALRANVDNKPMEALYFDTLAQIDVALGRLDAGLANYESAMGIDPGLSKGYAKKLSELGFLPLSNAPAGVLTALRRCIDLKKAACLISA
jgi:tetratricopeptide (TPR) repeat protein